MPPEAMASSVVVTIAAARRRPRRRSVARRTSSRFIGLGELGRRAEPAPLAVERGAELLQGVVQVRRRRAASGAGSSAGGPAERLDELAGALVDLLAAGPPGVVDGGQQLQERRLGEVRAAVERPPVGREEHRHRPAAATGHGLDRVHVDGVDVRALLAVDLDVDEQRRSSPPPPRRPRSTRGPSRGTSGTPSSRPRAGRAGPRSRAAANASSPHGYQSTGLSRCWRRYGEVSAAESVHRVDATGPSTAPAGSGAHGDPTGWEGRAGHRRVEGHRQGDRAAYGGAGARVMLSSRKQRRRWRRRRRICRATSTSSPPTPATSSRPRPASRRPSSASAASTSWSTTPPPTRTSARRSASTRAGFDKTFEVNVRGPVFWCRSAWKRALKDRPGVHHQHRVRRRAAGRGASSASTT